MMAINFPAAAFLAGMKAPSQIMYCISQDTGTPVVVYKDSQNLQQTINVQPWSGYNANHQQKELQQVNSPAINQQQVGNQVK